MSTAPDLTSFYFEDSYFLGIIADGTRLRIRMIFVLTIDHPEYTSPKKNEQHCYRNGELTFEEVNVLAWAPKIPSLTKDPVGTFDLGSINVQFDGGVWSVDTDWFEAKLEANTTSITLSENDE